MKTETLFLLTMLTNTDCQCVGTTTFSRLEQISNLKLLLLTCRSGEHKLWLKPPGRPEKTDCDWVHLSGPETNWSVTTAVSSHWDEIWMKILQNSHNFKRIWAAVISWFSQSICDWSIPPDHLQILRRTKRLRTRQQQQKSRKKKRAVQHLLFSC